MNPNPSAGRLVIGYNRAKMALILLSTLVFVAVGYAMVFHAHPGDRVGGLPVVLAGWIVMGFFALCAVAIGWNLRKVASGAALVLTSTGLSDLRLGRVEIPWSSIQGIEVITPGRSGQRMLRLRIDPAEIARLSLPQKGASLERVLMPRLGSGVTVSAIGLDIGLPELRATITAHWEHYRAAGHRPGAAMQHDSEGG